MKKYFTIGMAGHVDHGKTSLTKALTNWNTDILQAEKERQISIELGFAPLFEDEYMHVSLIDVPGHERFIRQMIAGVAGIDLVVLAVSAEEGVMPQTKEHLEILEFLGIQNGIVAITKMDKVDEMLWMLAESDIREALEGTVFKDAPLVMVDSLSGRGIESLRSMLLFHLRQMENRYIEGSFRLPIDQVFTVKGQGTVVRGTVYDGQLSVGDSLIVLPQQITTRARQLQLFGNPTEQAYAGQRIAINLAGLEKSDLQRGDVLVNSSQFITTQVIDVVFKTAKALDVPLKQRMQVKCHIGTVDVMGTIIFFDRKELDTTNAEVLCQLRLAKPIVAQRGDRFVLRRPSPQETIGGGWVIDPSGTRYKYGEETIAMLTRKRTGTDDERVLQVLIQHKLLSIENLKRLTAIDEEVLLAIIEEEEEIITVTSTLFTCKPIYQRVRMAIERLLQPYHQENPMRLGMPKAELLQKMGENYPRRLVEVVLLTEGIFTIREQHVALATFTPHFPRGWEKRIKAALQRLKKDGWGVRYLDNYLDEEGVPQHLRKDIARFLVDTETAVHLDADFYIGQAHYEKAIATLKAAAPKQFEVATAKEILGFSRKYLIPFLEKLDEKGITQRLEKVRVWK